MKPSFFERLTGAHDIEEEVENNVEERPQEDKTPDRHRSGWIEEENGEAELSVDVFQKPDEIVVKAMVAGVHPDDMDVDITRDMVTISGSRRDEREVDEDNYYYKELYWGSFSRTIMLPEEIDPDEAEAVEKNGLLTLHLPKIDKKKSARLKVKSR